MRIETLNDSHTDLTVSGEIDYHSAPRLRSRINKALQSGNGSITLKLDGVEFIDSTGLSVLLDGVKTAQSLGGRVTLISPSRQLVRVLKVSGFAPFFRVVHEGPPVPEEEAPEPVTDDAVRIETFEAEGRPENISALRRGVARFAEDLPFTRQELDDIKLAVGEASCNALRYGCPRGTESVHVTCTRRGRRFSVQISDQGPGFDPDQVPQVSEGHLAEGGRGIFFMRCLMDEVNFRFDNGTTVELVKYIAEPPAEQPSEATSAEEPAAAAT